MTKRSRDRSRNAPRINRAGGNTPAPSHYIGSGIEERLREAPSRTVDRPLAKMGAGPRSSFVLLFGSCDQRVTFADNVGCDQGRRDGGETHDHVSPLLRATLHADVARGRGVLERAA
jgi:hypothetical protein